MEAAGSSEMLIPFYQIAQHRIPEENNFQIYVSIFLSIYNKICLYKISKDISAYDVI
jgi:hypothetical protein